MALHMQVSSNLIDTCWRAAAFPIAHGWKKAQLGEHCKEPSLPAAGVLGRLVVSSASPMPGQSSHTERCCLLQPELVSESLIRR
jgi:hypothetical protein